LAEICSWPVAFFPDKLRRSELDAVKIWSAGGSINKGHVSVAKLRLLWMVYLLSLAGRGGEGGWEVEAVQGAAAWRWRGTAAPESFCALVS
jgi:hypothetical protein